jgi:hypothetical protein
MMPVPFQHLSAVGTYDAVTALTEGASAWTGFNPISGLVVCKQHAGKRRPAFAPLLNRQRCCGGYTARTSADAFVSARVFSHWATPNKTSSVGEGPGSTGNFGAFSG